MAPRKRVSKKGSKGKRQYKRYTKRSSYSRGVPERASVTENFSFTFNANQVYQAYNTNLQSCARATAVAKGYQMFRIKKVTWRLKPQADTFVPNSNSQVPYLYQMIDRTGTLSKITTADQLRQLGAKARRVDDKIVTWSYRPSVLTAVLDNEPIKMAVYSQYKISPWLPCDFNAYTGDTWMASQVNHLGCIWVLDQVNNAGSVPYVLETSIDFEFCKPAISIDIPSGPPPLPAFPIESDAVEMKL